MNGHAIRALRVAKRLTVTSLAREAGIKQPHLSLIEKGDRNPSEDVAHRIAWVLGLDDLRAIQRDPGAEWLAVSPVTGAA